jgi:hypothetical protein
MIFAANESSVLLDGKPIEGVRAIEYRQLRARTNIYALGSAERIGLVSGQQVVEARLKVASSDPRLDGLDPKTAFQIAAQLTDGTSKKTVTFDECYMTETSLELGVGSHGEAQYAFTATRVREG